jgi:hypothetical protein
MRLRIIPEKVSRFGETRVGASMTPVPLFALFKCFAPESGDALRANNAKGGTMPVEARSAYQVRIYSITPPPRHSSPS